MLKITFQIFTVLWNTGMPPSRTRASRDVPRMGFPCLLALVRQLGRVEGMGHTHQLLQERRKIALTIGTHELQWRSESVPYLHWLEEGNKRLPWLLRHGAGKCCNCLCLLTLPGKVEIAHICPCGELGSAAFQQGHTQYSAVPAHAGVLARQQETSSKLARPS